MPVLFEQPGAPASGGSRTVTGNYLGDGTTNRLIPLEFTPRLVIVTCVSESTFVLKMANFTGGLISPASDRYAGVFSSDLGCTTEGFYVSADHVASYKAVPMDNANGYKYVYAAYE